jgi:hypothetical protein
MDERDPTRADEPSERLEDVEGHARRSGLSETEDLESTEDVEGHRRMAFPDEEGDEGDEVEGHIRRPAN